MMKFCKKCLTDTEHNAENKCKYCERERVRKYRAENKERVLNAAAKRRSENREQGRSRTSRWRAANPEKKRAQCARWLLKNKDRARETHSAWQKANKEKCRIYMQNRRSRKRASGGNLSPGLADRLLKLQRGKCACGCRQPLGNDYHLDHIMPLALGGTNTDDNIQLLTAKCNKQKNAKHPVAFMQNRGFLL